MRPGAATSKPNHPRRATRKRPAFTLIEMLVVLSVIGILLVAVIPAVIGLSSSNNVNTGGRLIDNLLTVARSEAINRRTLVRFEIATDWPNDLSSAYRKITLVQHDIVTGSDSQISKWETLPTGIIFKIQDPLGMPPPAGSGKYFFDLGQQQNPKLKFLGSDVSTSYIEFAPTGALNVGFSDSPVRLRMVQGFLAAVGNADVTTTGATNWIEAEVDALVGRIRLTRP